MEVLIIQGAVGPDGSFKKGQTRELPEGLALQLIKDGIAIAVERKPVEKAERPDDRTNFKKRSKR